MVGKGDFMEIQNIPINKIKVIDNHRANAENVSDLMSSIRSHGLLQPIGLRKDKNKYIILYGNRRFNAVKKLGYKKIEAVIKKTNKNRKAYSDDIENLVENLQRSNPTTFDEGRYYEKLMKKGLTKQEISALLNIHSNRIEMALKVYQLIPIRFRKNVTYAKGKRLGNIGSRQASEVINASTTYNLEAKNRHRLFELCRDNRDFSKRKIDSTALAMVRGVKKPEKSVNTTTLIRLPLPLSTKKMKRWNKLNPGLHVKDFIIKEIRENKKIRQLM